jgi:hypothetical protein
MTTTNASDTFQPKHWDAAANQGAPAPYIPVLRGRTLQAYGEALESWGVSRETDDHTEGAGYGESISVITDPATGIVGYVTQWEWNSRVEWGVRTPAGFEKRGKSDTHTWPWDAVETVRHLIAHAAFRMAREAGELVGYWAEAQDFETARAANEAWVAQRIASYR